MSKISEPNFPHNQGRIGIGSQPSFSGYKKPVFCFQHLHNEHSLSLCAQHSEKRLIRGLMVRLEDLSRTDWNEIQLRPKEQGGSEKIPISALNCNLPNSISDDIESLLSIRFANTSGRIIGFRGSDGLFNVVYIDISLSVYRH